MTLRLEISEFVDANHWRWRLTDTGGAFLADHAVALDPNDPKYRALFDLPGYLGHYAAPDKRDEDERRLLQEVGAWIGATVLGSVIGEKILAHGYRPIVVRVVVPMQAEQLLVIPFEIAHARGKPLALQGVSLVFEAPPPDPDEAPPEAAPIGDRLRLLALFSLPPVGSPLNLRRERQMLQTVVRRLTRAAGLAVELRALQYGVTRDSLRDALQDEDGWDVIHFSGHGLPGSLVLETPEGRPDLISSNDVAQLLQESGKRLKLVVLSACLSAATSIQQTLSWLGLAEPRRDAAGAPAPSNTVEQAPQGAPTVARALVNSFDCGVLAMRYAVGDEFAMELGRSLFDGLFRQRQNLPRAIQGALSTALGANGAAAGALSVATPALFGAKAADLQLQPPKQTSEGYKVPDTGLAEFPAQPEHFVGRVTAMTRASAALAVEGQHSGVLFHGMAGAGKTACAVELTHHHHAVGRFQAFVWYRAPEADKDIQLALRDFALAMERQLPGLAMVHVVDSTAALKDWLPRLTELLEDNAILLVLDNLESLLSDSGQWRDERWGMLIDALLKPGGLSRVVLTSRIRPAGLPGSIGVIPVHALPLDEALLLVRELPNFRKLLDGAATGIALDAGRLLVRRTLNLVQGHPKLIEFAEKLAADPQRLAAQLDRAEAAQGAGELDAFFRDGETRLDGAMFAASLRNWSSGIAGALPAAARTFFHFLCALEESDRESWIIQANWADLWKRLGHSAPAPDIAELVPPLVVAGLVDKKTTSEGEKPFEILIHPGVAQAGRAEAGAEFQDAVDMELAATWRTVMAHEQEEYGKSPEAGNMIVRAGLAAFPYLSRRQDWATASTLLEQVDRVDSAPATIAALLPRMRRIVEATTETDRELTDRGLLARFILQAGRAQEAERELHAVIERAVEKQNFLLASALTSELTNLLRDDGRYDEALRVLYEMAEYTKRAGLGPWTQLSNEVQHLQILTLRGENEAVLRRVTELREQMKTLPDPAGPNEGVPMWNVREAILNLGFYAADELEEWQQALDFSREAQESKRERGAPSLELARFSFHDSGALLRLNRFEEAGELLRHCRHVFERENAVGDLGKVFSAVADLEENLGRPTLARQFEKTALRYKYAQGDLASARISHFNIANYVTRSQGPWSEAIAHRLAAVLIAVAMQSGRAAPNLSALVGDLQYGGPEGRIALPADLAALCATVEKIEGVRFREMIERFAGGPAECDELFRQVVTAALEAANKPE
jgi:tetratricopeptide (TPR) repeat protein